MWLRSLGFILFAALVFQGSFPADTAPTLRGRYGPPISETFLVKPGVVAAASYGPSGHICKIVVSPERLWNSTFEPKQLTEIIDELAPVNERGKFVDYFCQLLRLKRAVPQSFWTDDNLANMPAGSITCRSYDSGFNQKRF